MLKKFVNGVKETWAGARFLAKLTFVLLPIELAIICCKTDWWWLAPCIWVPIALLSIMQEAKILFGGEPNDDNND